MSRQGFHLQKEALSYDSLGKKLTMRASLDQLSGRDQVNLLVDLMSLLGISQAFIENEEAVKPALDLINRQTDIAWNKRT